MYANMENPFFPLISLIFNHVQVEENLEPFRIFSNLLRSTPTQYSNLDLFISIFVQNLFHKPTQTHFRQHIAVHIFVRKLGHSGKNNFHKLSRG